MGQGRGSAPTRPCLAIGIIGILCLLVVIEPALGATYAVGGNGGWTFNVAAWPNGKPLRAGDVLVFKYARAIHNVVGVNKRGYDSCKAPRGARVYQTGHESMRLRRGHNYFICTLPGHCQGGMKIDANAA